MQPLQLYPGLNWSALLCFNIVPYFLNEIHRIIFICDTRCHFYDFKTCKCACPVDFCFYFTSPPWQMRERGSFAHWRFSAETDLCCTTQESSAKQKWPAGSGSMCIRTRHLTPVTLVPSKIVLKNLTYSEKNIYCPFHS